MKDTIQHGTYAGLLGSLGDVLVHLPSAFVLDTSTTAHYIAQLIFPFSPVNTVRLTIGLIGHFIAGGLAGVLLAQIFVKWGRDHAILKGVGFGLALWLTHVAVIPNLVAPRPYLQRTELEALVDLAAHLSYGILAAGYLYRTGSRITPTAAR